LGIDLLFLITALLWLILFAYLIILHISQRRLARGAAQVYQSLEDLREDRAP